MKIFAVLFVVLFACCMYNSQAQPSGRFPRIMYVIFDEAPAYDSADFRSNIVARLHLRDSIRVLGVVGKYYRVAATAGENFVLWSNLGNDPPGRDVRTGMQRRAAGKEGRKIPATGMMVDSSEANAVSSESSASGSRKKGMKGAQCRAVTKSGRQCSRSTTDSSGYCWQHRK